MATIGILITLLGVAGFAFMLGRLYERACWHDGLRAAGFTPAKDGSPDIEE